MMLFATKRKRILSAAGSGDMETVRTLLKVDQKLIGSEEDKYGRVPLNIAAVRVRGHFI